MLVFRLTFPLLFLLLVFTVNKVHALDTNKIMLSSIKSPENICSESGGSLNPDVTVVEYTDYTNYASNGIAYSNFTSWVQNSSYNEKQSNYLVEGNQLNSTESALVSYVYGIDETNPNKIGLKFKSFHCLCESGTRDKYGRCSTSEIIHKFDSPKSPDQLCSLDGKIENATGVFTGGEWTGNGYGSNSSTADYMNQTFSRGSDNISQLYYVTKYPWTAYVDDYTSNETHISLTQSFSISRHWLTCTCPNGKDSLGLCLPFDCAVPTIEVSKGQCASPTSEDFCPDGGYPINGSCDRTCEDIGKFTVNTSLNPFNAQNSGKICVDKIDCDTYSDNCIKKCGSKSNVKSFTCVDTIGFSECLCRDDNLDDQVIPDEDIDENTPDSEINNSLLKSIKDENLKQSELQDEIASLLYTQNENDLTRENQLNNIDSKLSNIDGQLSNIDNSINGLNSGIDGIDNSVKNLNDDMNLGLDEVNQNLRDIKQNQDDDQQYRDDKDSELENKDSEKSSKFSELSSKMSELESFGNEMVSGLNGFIEDFNAVKQGFENGFNFSVNTTSSVPTCSTISLWGQTVKIDICTFIGAYRNIFSLFIQVILLYFSLKIFILAFRMARN
ncbi:MAG: hypothetical protein C0625_08420 [Arcobacter sp.]|nr:MAG: hypothetical protein C0625_08420 [Arcobacter sp.]